MDADAQHKEIRRLSLTSSVVFLAVFGVFLLIGTLPDEGLKPLIEGPFYSVLRFVPLVVAVVFIARVVYLRLTAGTRIPFVDGWLIQLSILGVYTVIFVRPLKAIYALWVN